MLVSRLTVQGSRRASHRSRRTLAATQTPCTASCRATRHAQPSRLRSDYLTSTKLVQCTPGTTPRHVPTSRLLPCVRPRTQLISVRRVSATASSHDKIEEAGAQVEAEDQSSHTNSGVSAGGDGGAPTPPDPTGEDEEEEAPGRFGLPGNMARSVSILTASQFVVTAGFGMIIPVLPMFSEQLGLGASGVGAIIAAPSAMRVVLNMPMGRMADRIGRKPLMVAGTLCSAMGGIGTGFATSLLSLLPFRAMVGAGSAASMAGSSAYMADLTTKAPMHRAKLLGVQQTLITAAFVTGPAIGGWLATMYGPQAAFMMVGTLTGVCSLGYSFLPETLKKKKLGAEAPKNDISWSKLLRDPNQQAIIAMNSGLFMMYAAQLSVVPLHAAEIWAASPAQLGFMFSVVSLMGLIGAPAGGWAADKFGRRWSVIPAACVAAAGMACLPFATDRDTFLGAMALLGLGTSFLTPGLTAFAADVAPPEQRAQALSVGRQAGDVVFATAPLLLGMLADVATNGVALGITSGLAVGMTALFGWRTRVGMRAQEQKP